MHMKSKRIKKVDFEKLDALCKVLECEPGDLVIRVPDEPES
jgi:putative transcriptional regulator